VTTFQHVVVIFQENRTPDNLFQGLCSPPFGSNASCSTSPAGNQYDIQTDNWADKHSASGTIHPTPVPLANAYDVDHSHSAFKALCDFDPMTGKCRMDGGAAVSCLFSCPPTGAVFRYVDNSVGIVNPYLQLATQYGWANYMFQTNQGPSFPAHQFIFGGTSAPSAADDAMGVFVAENTAFNQAGCIAPQGTTVQLIDSNGREDPKNEIYPCFEHDTLADVLPSSVSWRYYAPGLGTIWTAPNAIKHICQSTGAGGQCIGQSWSDNVDLKPADVLTDISNCSLRSISWVIPTGANSDHANTSDGGGPSWVASIVNAIGTSTTCDGGSGYWKNTAIVITWDDWGGWYDHEPPPILGAPQGGYQLGFRVPLLVVSPYTPVGYIDNGHHDFGSILRFIEHNFGVQQGILNFADARAQDRLENFFNFNQPIRTFQTIPAAKDQKFFVEDTRAMTDPDDE
jgi:phospholipase C